MSTRQENFILFLIGALSYGLIEILWRGSTHWTMALTGGACVLLLHAWNRRNFALPLGDKCAMGCVCITAVELAVGWLVNLRLGMGVWDYSGRPLNLLGQICPEYSAYWYLLSYPAVAVSNFFILRQKNRKSVFGIA